MDIKEIEEKLKHLGVTLEEGNVNESSIKIINNIEKTPERIEEEEDYIKYLQSI